MISLARSAALVAASLLVTLTAAGQARIWFVNNGSAGGDGSLAAPFHNIPTAIAASADHDVIYVFRHSSPYIGPATLKPGQLLVGSGIDVRELLTARSIDVPPSLPSAPGNPVLGAPIGDVITLANGASVAGFLIEADGGRGIVAENVSGKISIDRVEVRTMTGTAIAIEGGDAEILFDASPVTAASGAAISIANKSGGSVVFRNGSTVTAKAATQPAIALRDNKGQYAFADALQLTSAGACALCVTSSGELAITSGTSTIATTRAAAVDIASTKVDVYLQSVSVDAESSKVARAISLENASGRFRIGGGKVRGATRAISVVRSSGVAIEGMTLEKSAAGSTASPACTSLSEEKELGCNAAIQLLGATDVSLKNVRIEGSGEAGIFGDRVTNLTLDGVVVQNAGDEHGEHGIQLRELHGRSVIYGTTVKDSATRQLYIMNREGEGSLEIRKSTFDGGPPPNGAQGILVALGRDAKLSVVIEDTDFVQTFSDGVHAIAEGRAQLELVVHSNRFAKTASAVNVVADREARAQYRITDNVISGAAAAAINVRLTFSSGGSSGMITGNTIGKTGVAGSGASCGSCSGIRIVAGRGGSSQVTVRNNTVQQVDGAGIAIQADGNAELKAAVTGNTIRQPYGAQPLSAISAQSGVRPADGVKLCLDVNANKISGGWDPAGAAIALRSKGTNPLALGGYTGAGEAASVNRFVAGRNSGASAALTGAAAAGSCF